MIDDEIQQTTEDLLIPQDLYLQVGIHIGTKFKTKDMQRFIYKTRSNGLSVLNISMIDERLKAAADLMSKVNKDEIIVCCRRENGWKGAKKFQKYTGIKVFAGRYPPGILTNTSLSTFTETKLMLVVDAWPDRNAVKDASVIGVPVIALCDTNNQANNIDLVVPCNNKGKKSLELIFYILAKEILKNTQKLTEENLPFTVEDFVEE